VNITPVKISVTLTDLNLQILDSLELRINNKIAKEELIAQINEGVHRITRKVARERILGIGISSPGQIDAKEGKVIVSHSITNWRDVPLASVIEQEWKIPACVEHNVKAMAMRELWVGTGNPERNFIVMKIGYGIGAGIVIDRNVYRGATGNSGELGHTKIQQDGPLCTCGSRGCYESLADLSALEERMKKRLLDFQGNYEDIFQLAKEGNKEATEAIEVTASYLARGIVNLIHLLNLPLILIGGEVAPYWPQLAPFVLRTLDELALETLRKGADLRLINHENDAEAQGAAAIVFDREFRIPVQKS